MRTTISIVSEEFFGGNISLMDKPSFISQNFDKFARKLNKSKKHVEFQSYKSSPC